MNDTPTPRTDALGESMKGSPPGFRAPQWRALCTQLERELASTNAKLESLDWAAKLVTNSELQLPLQQAQRIEKLELELAEAKAKLEKFESLQRPPDRVMQHPFDHPDFGKGASEP